VRRGLGLVLVTLLAAGVVGACGDDGDGVQGVSGDRIETLPGDLLRSPVLGLEVSTEDISDALTDARRSYVDGSAMYAFRTENLLQATLQVNRFSDEARPESAGFRSTVVAQIGGSRAQQVRVGDADVFLTRGSRQRIAIWFKGDYFFILSTREDFDRPRTLLREVLEVQP
jgi:hypothetical protein